ncbi:RecQ family zinc-binding domain-containing protein, partial [Raoultella sp. 18092]|uniref:RecQ family zinc-binding domain-containing protein n=1 Tax=Raoultella sp. 18092 TaxID=2681424 RepID=UPI00190FB540
AQKRTQDQDGLERMVFYAQTGGCRWEVLLDYFGHARDAQRCGTCDNCRRIAALDAQQAIANAAASAAAVPPTLTPAALGTARRKPSDVSAIVVPAPDAAAADAKAAAPARPVFELGMPVRVKRYGEGT